MYSSKAFSASMELRTCSQSVCVGRTEKKRSSSPGQFPFGRHLPAERKKSPSCGKLDERKGFLPRNEDPFGTGAGSRSVRHFHQQPARGRLHLPAKRREGRGTENRDQKERKALNAAYAPVRQRKKNFIEFRSFPDMFSFIVIGHCPECKTGWIVFPLYFMNSDLAPENGW